MPKSVRIQLNDQTLNELEIFAEHHRTSAETILYQFVQDLLGTNETNGSDERERAQRYCDRVMWNLIDTQENVRKYLNKGLDIPPPSVNKVRKHLLNVKYQDATHVKRLESNPRRFSFRNWKGELRYFDWDEDRIFKDVE